MSRKIWYAVIALVIIAAGVWGITYYHKHQKKVRQAVFMTNGQVYFGYITKMNNLEIELDDVYYLKTDQLTQNPDPNAKIYIVKMGNELHAPESKMIIMRTQILFYQPIKNSSKINTAIQKFVNNPSPSPSISPSPSASK